MQHPNLFDAAASRQLRDRGISISESYPNDQFVTKARAIAEMLAIKNGTVTINNVLKIFPKPDDISPNVLGSVMRNKNLKLVGYEQSDKISAHYRRIGIFSYAPQEK